jgi:UDP-GlcNAc:undecaprenyl-phosphate GlcNAc-1-phosphate transferase
MAEGTRVLNAALAGSAVLTFALGAWLTHPVLHLLEQGGLVRENYRMQVIPTGAGLLLPLAVTPSALLLFVAAPSEPLVPLLSAELVLLNGMALLGLLDDSAGGSATRGLVGHLRFLWRGELTTGGVKALYGVCIALLAVSMLPEPRLLARVIPTAVIALSANAVNLFDLRPGRALKVFFLAYVVLILTTGSTGVLTLLVAVAALTIAPRDFAGQAMMGDTGSNVLGSMLGLFVTTQMSLHGQIWALVLLVALHTYAEVFSINRLIERVSVLTWLDSLGR